MRRRGWMLFQVTALAAVAAVYVSTALGRATAQVHELRAALDAEQAAVMLDALEQLPGEVSLKVEGWTKLSRLEVAGPLVGDHRFSR